MRGTIKRLDGSGHTAVEYDTDTGIVEEAEKILTVATMQRSMLFDGITKQQIHPTGGVRSVLEQHESVIVVPPMAGG